MGYREIEILLVEDNPDDEFLILRAMRKHKVSNHIHVVRDGEEALDYLLSRRGYAGAHGRENLKLVLLDINLPKLSGLEVLAAAKQDPRTRHIPMVLLTSSKTQEEMLRAYMDGANSFLQKPVDFQDFEELVKNIGFYWMSLNEHPGEITVVARDTPQEVAEPMAV